MVVSQITGRRRARSRRRPLPAWEDGRMTQAEYETWLQDLPKLPPVPRSAPVPRRSPEPYHPLPTPTAAVRPKPALDDDGQESFMLDALERLDYLAVGQQHTRKTRARQILSNAPATLPPGDRLAVIEEQAMALIGPRPDPTRPDPTRPDENEND